MMMAIVATTKVDYCVVGCIYVRKNGVIERKEIFWYKFLINRRPSRNFVTSTTRKSGEWSDLSSDVNLISIC